VQIGSVFMSPNPGEPGALNGTATSVTIPAGTLQTNQVYTGSAVGFLKYVSTTNGNSYVTFVYRGTWTSFTLSTAVASPTGPLRLTNAAYASGIFSFDVLCSTGQTVTVEYRTNLAVGTWKSLMTTNSSGSQFHATASQAATNSFLFFRARNGP
jgi:hypothetical protein